MPHYERCVKHELLFSKLHEQLEAKSSVLAVYHSFQIFFLELPKMFEKPTAQDRKKRNAHNTGLQPT